VIPKRPINRDVPSAEETETRPEEKKEAKSAPQEKAKPPRRPKSQTPMLLAGLVALALAFIVVAIVFASGSGDESEGGGEVTPSAPAGGSGDDDGSSPQTAEAPAFPAFATSNTTRIGGSDAAANAAGVALAVFPSTSAAQRPAAVTVVDEEDPEGAIAASVLMAPPVRAPILFSQDRALPETSAAALEALDPAGTRDTGGVAVFHIGAVLGDVPTDRPLRRISGARPTFFGLAAAIASTREKLAGPPSHFVIAPVAKLEYAAPAAAWAARSGDPVLYVEPDRLPPETAGVLDRHPKVPVYVLGPESVIEKSVLKAIGKISKSVKRVAGKDAVGTALALARYHDGSFGWNVNDPGHGFVLARSDSPTNVAASAALSGSGTWGPLLLTEDTDRLPAAVRSYFLDVKPGYTTDPTRAFYNHVWVIGDQSAISVAQQAEVNELTELTKIGGGE
jgi:hypothetical protein